MSTGESLRRKVTLASRNGLHLTPITSVVKKASEFACEIRILFDGKTANAKSAMDLMLLGATFGANLDIEATGDDAERAIDAVATILETERA